MTLNLKQLTETRHTICKSCPFYNENDTCRYLIKKTARVGALFHATGIRNPYSRCPHPDRYWYSITSYHPWYLMANHILPLDREQRHQYTKHGIGKEQPLSIVNHIYDYYDEHPELPPPPIRSLLLQELASLSQSLNGYHYLQRMNLTFDYVTGDVT